MNQRAITCRVASETSRLRAVLVHEPGHEIDRMVPSLMEQLLFDDILYGDRARAEHRRFRRILEQIADDVLLVGDLVEDVLQIESARAELFLLLKDACDVPDAAIDALKTASPQDAAKMLIEGIPQPKIRDMPADPAELFVLAPLPNLVFHRDPAAVIGQSVVLASMATPARLREPTLFRTILHHHPRFSGNRCAFDRIDHDFRRWRSTAKPRLSIEGGDIIVARHDILLIGHSVRTNRHSIEQVAQTLRDCGSEIHTILVVELPRLRSYMHLDTVFTLISEHECLIHKPVILAGQAHQAAVYELDLKERTPTYRCRSSLLSALKELGCELEPIVCGGQDDPIAQQREQWTDGANAFALDSGVILLYQRNQKTADELSRHGYRIVSEDDVIDGQVSLTAGTEKLAILLSGQELSRARGGPRCLTMPLERW